jgi:hypothetical protein
MKQKIKVNSIVVFNEDISVYNTKTKKKVLFRDKYPLDYIKYFKHLEDRQFIYLGDIVQSPGHCILIDMEDGHIEVMHHTDNFRVLTEDEV